MVTATLVNESPMTMDLEFDLGEVIKCVEPACSREAQWLGTTTCGCFTDLPVCDPCRDNEIRLTTPPHPYVCLKCGRWLSSNDLIWRKL